ncbi:hypothetical protein ACQ7NX_20730 [Enterobacter cloacae subsp. dissolvens]
MNEFSSSYPSRSLGKILRGSVSALVILLMGCMTLLSLKQVNVLAEELSALKDTMPTATNTEPLELELSHLKFQLERLENTAKASDSEHVAAIESLNQSLSSLRQRLQDEILRLDALQTQVQNVEHRQKATPPVPLVNPTPDSLSSKRTNVKRTVSARKTIVNPPFILTAVENRGGIAFAAVVQSDAKRLAHVNLLEVGQTLSGWTLQSLNSQQATFRHDDVTRTLTVR